MQPRRSFIDRFAVVLAHTMMRFNWLVIIASIIGAGYIGMNAQNLAFDNNFRVFFSKENPELRNFENFQDTYTKSDTVTFFIKTTDGSDIFSNKNLEAIHELTERSWQLPYSVRVDSLTNFQNTYAIDDELIVENLIPNPGAMTDAELEEKKRIAYAEPILNGQLLAESGNVTNVVATLTFPERSSSEAPEAVAAARALRNDIAAAYPHLEFRLSGTTMLNNAFSEATITDLTSLIPLMTLIIFIAAAIVVRSVSVTISIVLLVILSSVTAMGWAGQVGIKLAGPSPMAVVVILTLAIADAIHILMTLRTRMQAGMEKREAIVEAVRVNFLAVTITSITTIIGFMSLNFSDAPPFRDFGNIAAVGILAAWFLSLTFLPAALSLTPYRVKAVAKDGRVSPLRRLADVVIAHNRKLMVLMGALAVGLIAQIPSLELSDEFRKYFDHRVEFRRDTDVLAENFGFYPIEFSLEAGESGGVSNPEYLEQLSAFTDWARAHPSVVHVFSVSDIMKRLNKNMNADDPAFYKLPDDRELAAQYLLLYEISLPFGLDLTDRINIDKSATRVTVTLDGETDTMLIKEFLNDAEVWFDKNPSIAKAPATSPPVMFTFIAQRNVESMVTGTTIAIIAIAFIMMLALRSIPMGLLSMAPNALPILASFGVWALLYGKVGFSVAAVASISLGIVIDDTVHFLIKYMRARREGGLSAPDAIRYAFETVGAAILFNTFILAAGFAILIASSFQINKELGILTTMSIGFATLFDFLLLPGILLLRDKSKTI